MQITFSPMRRDDDLTLERQGESLIINGSAFDFTPLQDGAELPAEAINSSWFAGPVRRCEGVLHLHLVLPHGAGAAAARLFPSPITQSCDGVVPLPPIFTSPKPESQS